MFRDHELLAFYAKFCSFYKTIITISHSNERILTFYVKKDNDWIAMTKPRKELLSGYIYPSTGFHACSTITKYFWGRVQLTPSTRNSNPSL